MPQPTTIGLFSGAGGLDLGLHLAGFATLAVSDIDSDCAATLRANRSAFGQRARVLELDVTELRVQQLASESNLGRTQLTLLAGGPPCQAFTTSGRRRALRDDRGSLVGQYLRILSGLKPKYFLMENVTGFFSAALRHRPLRARGSEHEPLSPDERKGSVFRWFLEELIATGYSVTWGVLDAIDFGVPQFRQRAFLIGTTSSDPVFLPTGSHGPTQTRRGERWRTLRDALAGLVEANPQIQPLSEFKVNVFRHIPPGANWRSLPVKLRKETMGGAFFAEGGRSGWWRRLTWDRPAPTILTMPDHSSTALIHPDETRCLSVRECARCQTFPDSFEFQGASRSKYSQIGNAVPVELARALGNQILAHLKGKREAPPSPPTWRKESANQRLGTWGWVSNRDQCVHVLYRRPDHIELRRASRQLELLSA